MLVLTDVQQVSLAIEPKSAAGNPTVVDDSPQWSVSDESIITLVVAEGGLSAQAVTTGKLGTVQINVTADAALDEEVRPISGVLDVEVMASEAVGLDITTGAPESRL